MHMCRSGGSDNRQMQSRKERKEKDRTPEPSWLCIDGSEPNQQRKKRTQIVQTSANSTEPDILTSTTTGV